MFDQFSDEQLKDIFELNETDEEVKKIIYESRKSDELMPLREHAFGEYWMRRIKVLERINVKDVSKILDRNEFVTSKGIVGEIAKKGIIVENDYSELKQKLDVDDGVISKF